MHRIKSWAKAHAFSSNDSPDLESSTRPDVARSYDGQVNTGAARAQSPTTAGPEDDKEKKSNPSMFLRCLCHTWVNILLVFVPIGIAAEAAHLNPNVIFAMNAVAIIPLAGLLSHATESVATRLGDTIGALINVTFGNAVELIIFIIALVKNEIRIVQASLLGSILANLLLILGMAFLLGGLRFQEQIYNSTVTQMSACLLSLSVTSLLLPTAFHASFSNSGDADRFTLKVSRGTSVVLLLVYILYILFQLKSHSYLYASIPQAIIDEESHPGLLHDLMNSSSDSSSSSSEGSVDTTTSWTTAKRIKRAMKHRRHRKSSTSSKSSSTKDKGALAMPSERSPKPPRRQTTRSTILRLPLNSTSRASRDFGAPASRINSIGSTKSEKRGRRKRLSKPGKVRVETPVDHGLMTEANRPSMKGFASTPNFAGMEGVGPDEGSRKRSPFNLLTNTVFSSQNPSQSPHPGNTVARPALYRSSSLPAKMRPAPAAGNPVQFARGAARTAGAPPTAPVDGGTVAVGEDEPDMSRTAAVVLLLISTALVAVCAEFLVDAIPDMLQSSNVSEAFIGLIILPIVGNAAEHVTAVSVATKNKMDLAIGVSVGSSIQIAIFVTPLVVILGWCMDKDMSLYFTLFETISLFVTAFVVNFLVLDGRSNYLEGALLIAAYVIIALASYFYPDGNNASALAGAN
ncbi:hypothetical protein N7470_006564 [Penicillium chermesinum]|nr:hypothetical protein N7470_006564 [Penicillium chermesinum]